MPTTYGVLFTSDFLNWVEVGYRKKLICSIGCSSSYRIWGEWGFYPNVVSVHFYGNANVGTSISFRANQVSGTFDWKIWYDPNGGTNFQLLDTYTDMDDTHGWAYGEASRVGKTGTDNVDHHWSMKYRDSAGVWKPTTTLICQNDLDPDYQWRRVSSTEFYVEAGPGYC